MELDRVRAELEARRDEGAVLRRLGGLKQMASTLVGGGVPRPVRTLVEEAFAGELYHGSSLRGEIAERFHGLSDADWRRTIHTLLPHIEPGVRAAWAALERRPYQVGGTRKPFRAPRSADTLAGVRGRWLVDVALLLGDYDADIRWVTERAAYLSSWWGGADIGWLLAGAIDAGDDASDEVYERLAATARGEHGSDAMGRHVTQALMSCARPDAWAQVERLLLAAQREEGLRQTILESVDESHPEAFRRMLRLVLDENLTRFSSVVRAADTWFGFMWDGASAMKIDAVLRRVLLFLDDPAARDAALGEKDAETVYLALWSIAFDDVDAAIAPASALLSSGAVETRFVATHFLAQTLWSSALEPLVDMLADADLRVAARALDVFGEDRTKVVDGERLFHNIEALLVRVPKRSQTLGALVWPWWKRKLERPFIAAALSANARAVRGERLLPHVPDLDPDARASFVRQAAGLARPWERRSAEAERREMTPAERVVVLDLLGDASADVRAIAFEAMRELPLEADEVDRLVELLGRKPGDLRSNSIARLRALDDARLLAAADTLLADASDLRRLAGLELLRDAAESERAVGEVRARLERHAAAHPELTEQERTHVDAVLGERQQVATRDDALGLVDPRSLRTWPEPRRRDVVVETDGAIASLASLAGLVVENQETEVRSSSGETRLLVESVGWSLRPRPRQERDDATDGAGDGVTDGVTDAAERTDAPPLLPLADVWRGWLERRPDTARDPDGLEVLRLLVSDRGSAPWKTPAVATVCGTGRWNSGYHFLHVLLEWCVVWDPPRGAVEFLLDGLERSIAELTPDDYRAVAEAGHRALIRYAGEREQEHHLKLVRAGEWLNWMRWWRELFPGSVHPAHAERLYGLLRTFQARSQGAHLLQITLDDFLGAHRAGVVDEAEFTDLLVGRWSYRGYASLLRATSTRKPPRALAAHPELLAVVDRCRRRVVEVETQRGDRATAASELALDLRWTGGLETLTRALPALGKSRFSRTFGWSPTDASRQDTLSHLVLRSTPREEDTPEAFARWAREARLKEARLVELALYAPQWAAHVNQVLEWPGLDDAVWWIQAHTKDDRSWQLQELKEVWAAEVSERTPLAADDLTEGGVDVAWFRRVHDALGAERWKVLDAAAKYAASSAGHTRAQLFARAMTGLVTRDELMARIDESRHQDSVRALGLVPLAGDDANGDAARQDVLARYRRLEAFRREARRFGSQRQQSESRAVAIAMENLARTAGFRDPQRLRWAMEQEAVADLARGPVVLERGDLTLTLSIDGDGVPSLAIARKGKALKTLPAALKKDDEVAELRDRLRELRRQRSRVRDALEEAMCRGDTFGAAELQTLLEHPILAPALSRLVFVGDGIAGYPVEGGRALRDHTGALHVLGSDEAVRVAHPHDLLARGDWSAWQRECFRAERIQPFKQLFRELYPMTATERGTHCTRRYAGHQVNPRQALALLGGRGWVARPEEGVSRTFHDAGLTVRLAFQEAFHTPADVEGLTLEEVVFTRKGEWNTLALDEIPERLFSEAMRDLDLVVSVAHRGGVDPEATASTVEMRAALVQETCELLGLANVELTGHHAIVRGELAEYSVHLGSAGVMVLPGTFIPIVAVHSQHRGRLFLPFADDDPRTAEVLSKVLMLARDGKIRDPNVLEWIRAARGRVVA